MLGYEDSINRQFGQQGLSAKILDALENAGKDINALRREDLSSFDEFHSGGLPATRGLAELAGLRTGMRVLDIGSGIGGPARTLAAEYDCIVTGVDLTEEFCQAAEMLTARLGLSDRVTFQQGNALDLPFDDQSFDVVWTQNVIMNIEDKRRLFNETHRVLRPGGLLAFQALMAGPVPNLRFPVMWANDPSLNFLLSPSDFRQLLAECGFQEIVWHDVTQHTIEFNQRRDVSSNAGQLNLGVIVDLDVAQKAANVLRNFEEDRTLAINGVFKRD